ncbi:MAG: hypothetical protein U1E46_09270 [Hyphomicrobiales bacterium]
MNLSSMRSLALGLLAGATIGFGASAASAQSGPQPTRTTIEPAGYYGYGYRPYGYGYRPYGYGYRPYGYGYRPYYGPRYAYPRYGYPYFYQGYYYPRIWWNAPAYAPPPPPPGGGRCSSWASACANNWGVNNPNYNGCLRYHGCL